MKLVRDGIPELIKKSGKVALHHIAQPDEIKKLLFEKLLEEVNEFIKEPSEEELIDIYEVLDALIKEWKFNADNLVAIRKKKANINGVYDKKIVLDAIK